MRLVIVTSSQVETELSFRRYRFLVKLSKSQGEVREIGWLLPDFFEFDKEKIIGSLLQQTLAKAREMDEGPTVCMALSDSNQAT